VHLLDLLSVARLSVARWSVARRSWPGGLGSGRLGRLLDVEMAGTWVTLARRPESEESVEEEWEEEENEEEEEEEEEEMRGAEECKGGERESGGVPLSRSLLLRLLAVERCGRSCPGSRCLSGVGVVGMWLLCLV